MDRFNSLENVTLLMANRIYLMKDAKMLESFNNVITEQFQSEVQLLDFTNVEESARIINNWVEKQTREKIKNLISEDDLNEWTRLVFVNAIYFKANWKYQFDKRLTKTQPFYLSDVDKVNMKMMHMTRKFNYKNDKILDAQVLEMLYTNEDLGMIIILPNRRNGLQKLEEKLVNINLDEITQGMGQTDVNVALPRFTAEQTIDLKDSLTKLGLGEIFDKNKANFKGMIRLHSEENLYVSKAIQKVFIEVNEDGAEAGGATGLEDVILRNVEVPAANFTADHPFIYILHGKRSGHLIMGRLNKPSF